MGMVFGFKCWKCWPLLDFTYFFGGYAFGVFAMKPTLFYFCVIVVCNKEYNCYFLTTGPLIMSFHDIRKKVY